MAYFSQFSGNIATQYFPGTVNNAEGTIIAGGVAKAPFHFKNLYITTDIAPGTGENVIVTLLKNGTTSTLSISLDDEALSGFDDSSVAIGDGDVWTFIVTKSGGALSTKITAQYQVDNG